MSTNDTALGFDLAIIAGEHQSTKSLLKKLGDLQEGQIYYYFTDEEDNEEYELAKVKRDGDYLHFYFVGQDDEDGMFRYLKSVYTSPDKRIIHILSLN